jgi:hypothetical protein
MLGFDVDMCSCLYLQRLNTTSTEQGLMATRHEVQQLLQQQQQQQQLSPATTAEWPHDPDFVVQPEKRLAVSLVMMEDVILAPHVKRAVINLKALSQLVVKVSMDGRATGSSSSSITKAKLLYTIVVSGRYKIRTICGLPCRL